MKLGLYIHIPFCAKKCTYCDFVSFPSSKESLDLWEKYINALIEEFKLKADFFKLSMAGTENRINTVFIGGGTPSMLPAALIAKLMQTIKPYLASGAEVTIEANPGTIDAQKLKSYLESGINRISLGIQSFNPAHLKTLGRIHSSEEAVKAINDVQASGFINFNLDLIYGLPNQEKEDWEKDLQTALSFKPNHISVYGLQVEEGTPLKSTLEIIDSPLELPTEDIALEMFLWTIETLKAAGYHHYEISNFSKPGDECRHNLNYWQNGNYLGIGVASHSHIDGRRFHNPNCLEEYFTSLNKGQSYLYKYAPEDQNKDRLMVGLRLIDGIDLTEAELQNHQIAIKDLTEEGLIQLTNHHLKLTPKGLPIANQVFMEFI